MPAFYFLIIVDESNRMETGWACSSPPPPPGLLGWALPEAGWGIPLPSEERKKKWILLPTEKLSGLCWGDGSSSWLKYYNGEAWQPAGCLPWTSEAPGQLKNPSFQRETGGRQARRRKGCHVVLAGAVSRSAVAGRGAVSVAMRPLVSACGRSDVGTACLMVCQISNIGS